MTEEFEWPCWKRYAHGPHKVDSLRSQVASRMSGVDKRADCPGVKSHPATMIGGNVPEEVWNDGSGEVWKA